MPADVNSARTPGELPVPECLLFEPLCMPRVWGGRTLEARLGRTLPPGPVGESWELVDRAEANSKVESGPLRGISLHTLWTEAPHLFDLGLESRAKRPERFPLLIKLLDCRERLSVQVHPDEEAAAELGGESKHELWVFLETAPDAEVFAGLRAHVRRETFEEALTRGGSAVVPLLKRFRPLPGDCMFMPAGRLHAIGAGVLLCELQSNSDTTFRVYDWDRRGLDGRPRPLHTAQSLRSIHFGAPEARLERTALPELLAHPFRVERLHPTAPFRFSHPEQFRAGVVLAGHCRLGSTLLEPGRTFLVPADAPGLLEPLGSTPTLLRVSPQPYPRSEERHA